MGNQPYEQQGHSYQDRSGRPGQGQPDHDRPGQGQPVHGCREPYGQQGNGYQEPYGQQEQAHQHSYGQQEQAFQQPYEHEGQPYQQPYQQPYGQPGEQLYEPSSVPHATAQAPTMPAQPSATQPSPTQPSPVASAAWAAVPQGSGAPAPDVAPTPHAPASTTPEAPAEQPPLTAAGGTPRPSRHSGRARAEGRSPIIEPGSVPAALTAVLALLLSGAAAVGSYALLVPLVVLQGVTAAGWFRLNGMWPARQGIALAFLGALAADAALLAADQGQAPAVLLATAAVWLLLAIALQLRSRASADERITGLMATVVSAALAIAAAGHLAADRDAVTVAGFAVAAALLVRAVPLPTTVSALLALVAATAAGAGAAQVTDYDTREGALLGLGIGLCALIGHRVASYDYPSRFVHMTAGVALPLTAAAPAVYLLGQALT